MTEILGGMEEGDAEAASRLLPVVYDELRRLAVRLLAQERPGQTLQPTALVHEAYLRLVDDPHSQRWDSRRHFFAAAAEAMRRILIEAARRKSRVKHGGELRRVEFEGVEFADVPPADELESLNQALEELAAIDPKKAELVKLRYFAGLSLAETADVLGISRATASRYWAFARAWLFDRVHGDD